MGRTPKRRLTKKEIFLSGYHAVGHNGQLLRELLQILRIDIETAEAWLKETTGAAPCQGIGAGGVYGGVASDGDVEE